MNYQSIEVDVSGHVGIIRLNRPEKLNAVTTGMIDEVNLALDHLTHSVRAIILTGNGRAFCSGAALGGVKLDPHSLAERDFGGILETHINPLMLRLSHLPIPWISSVRGAAAGVGASLGLAGDLVVASENAYFLHAFARIGLVPDGGSTHLLVRTVGRVRAMELLLLGDKLPAAKAYEWGLINRVVADASLGEQSMALAQSLARGATLTLGLIRKSVWHASDAAWNDVLCNERNLQLIAGRTDDSNEGISAFNGKRVACFKGF
jgi:2-(1,2-epoxy-1,2-dihydrophenyl)acetyl-CoA isomerase